MNSVNQEDASNANEEDNVSSGTPLSERDGLKQVGLDGEDDGGQESGRGSLSCGEKVFDEREEGADCAIEGVGADGAEHVDDEGVKVQDDGQRDEGAHVGDGDASEGSNGQEAEVNADEEELEAEERDADQELQHHKSGASSLEQRNEQPSVEDQHSHKRENIIQIDQYGDIQKDDDKNSTGNQDAQIKASETVEAVDAIDAIQVPDEPSSIIIDTKVTTGVPILSREQREEYMRRNLGEDYSETSESGSNSPKQDGQSKSQNTKTKTGGSGGTQKHLSSQNPPGSSSQINL